MNVRVSDLAVSRSARMIVEAFHSGALNITQLQYSQARTPHHSHRQPVIHWVQVVLYGVNPALNYAESPLHYIT